MKASLLALPLVLLYSGAEAASIAGYLSSDSMAWAIGFDHKLQYALITPPDPVTADWNDEALFPSEFSSSYVSYYTGDAVVPSTTDANGDGKTTVIEYLAVGQYFMYDSSMPEWLMVDGEGIRPADCDFNGNDFVDIWDAGMLLNDIVSEGYIVVCTNVWPAESYPPESGRALWNISLLSGTSTGVIRQYGMRDTDLCSDTATFGPGHVLFSGQFGSANMGAYCGLGPGYLTITEPGAPLHSGTDLCIAFQSDGTFSKYVAVPPGAYDIVLSRPGALTKRFSNVFIEDYGTIWLDGLFWFGDIDGDNAVTVFDYSILSEAFDQNESMPTFFQPTSLGFKPYDCDFDHDGVITMFDYAILSESWDKEGE